MSYEVCYVYHVNSFNEVIPANGKFGICVSGTRGYFLTINTLNRQHYDCIPILMNEHPQLGQDRFVACSNVVTVPTNANIEKRYKISTNLQNLLIQKIESSRFLSKSIKLVILEELRNEHP